MKKKLNFLLIFLAVFFCQKNISQVNTDLRPSIKSPEINKF